MTRGNISFKKVTFNKLGKFDEIFKVYGWEDLELGYRFYKSGIKLYYLKDAINYHYHVVTEEDELERNIKKGESARLFLNKHPELKWFGIKSISTFIFKLTYPKGVFFRNL